MKNFITCLVLLMSLPAFSSEVTEMTDTAALGWALTIKDIKTALNRAAKSGRSIINVEFKREGTERYPVIALVFTLANPNFEICGISGTLFDITSEPNPNASYLSDRNSKIGGTLSSDTCF